jgi:hypothetical protein
MAQSPFLKSKTVEVIETSFVQPGDALSINGSNYLVNSVLENEIRLLSHDGTKSVITAEQISKGLSIQRK